MIWLLTRSKRTDTLCPYTTIFRSQILSVDGCEDDIVFDLFSAIIGHCAEYRGIDSLEADEGMICLFVLEFMTRFGRSSTDAIGHQVVETFAVMIDCPGPARMTGKFGKQTSMRLIGHLSLDSRAADPTGKVYFEDAVEGLKVCANYAVEEGV